MLLYFSLITTASAQEDTTIRSESLGGVADSEAFHWQDGHEWNSLSLNAAIRAVSSTWNDRLLAMDDSGRIYRLEGDGSWKIVFQQGGLGESVNMEDLLLSVEGALQEQWDTVDDVNEEFDEETEELLPLDAIENEWEVVIDDPLLQQQQLGKTYSLWTDERLPLVFACYTTGCVLSDDNGDSWSVLEELPSSTDFTVYNRKYFAATSSGVWVSTSRGADWRPALQFPRTVVAKNFAVSPQGVFVSTDDGIWTSTDGEYWKKIYAPSLDNLKLQDILITLSGDFWVSSLQGIFYSGDGGRNFSVLTERMAQILLEDEWNSGFLSFSQGQVFETVDTGESWQNISNQLPNSYIHDANIWKGGFVVANDSGIFYIRPMDAVAVDKETVREATEDALSLETLIAISTEEINTQLEGVQVNNRTQLLRWVPTFSVQGTYGGFRVISANYDAISTKGDWTIPWTISTNFCFGTCQSASTDVGFSDLSDSVMVVGNSVYRTDLGGVVPAASSVSTELQKMKRQRIQKVIGLHSTSERLVRQKERLANAPLLEQSFHEIEIQEVDAILDLYTNGKYSATRRYSKENP